MKDRLAANSNHLAVFAASLRCIDEVKVVSRRTPRTRTSVTWGIWRLASAAEKDRERGGRFLQVQAEESEERRRLDWDRGNTIITSSAKKESRISESGRQITHI